MTSMIGRVLDPVKKTVAGAVQGESGTTAVAEPATSVNVPTRSRAASAAGASYSDNEADTLGAGGMKKRTNAARKRLLGD